MNEAGFGAGANPAVIALFEDSWPARRDIYEYRYGVADDGPHANRLTPADFVTLS